MNIDSMWIETVATGWNILVGGNPKAIRHAADTYRPPLERPTLYGDRFAAEPAVVS